MTEQSEQKDERSLIPQYSLSKILLIWAAAAIPMGILGWVVAPALAHISQTPALVRLAVLTVGLAWQFVLVMILLYREAGNLRWSTIRQRLWLTTPRSPRTGTPSARLWWWLVPLVLLTAIYELQISRSVDHLWVSVFPFFAAPSGFDLSTILATPQAQAQLVGAWNVWGLFLLSALFNTFLGEELLFRGFLLPRMAGVFGKGDWVMNGLLFGLYHLHQPSGILDSVIAGFLFAFPSRRFRSAWFGIVAHSGQSVYLALLILALVLK
ncbi:MAG TPA: CPBP family intramembrane glutamic endopeptidase [Ktedonosporobacter sp.]|nr:CPBP family intramembrane glutamic endopeptidase [Ktedonosporobacter sp.]